MVVNVTTAPVVVVKTAWSLLSSAPLVGFITVVTVGILGNSMVILIVGENILGKRGSRSSDMILVNMAFSNLTVSITRNLLVVLNDLGIEILTTKSWCQALMGLWMWTRCANVWSTFYLSVFHFYTLRRVTPTVVSLTGYRGPPRTLLMGFGLVWTISLIYSSPAFVFSTKAGVNTTETLMFVTGTTRPVLGCLWDFPTIASGLAFATTSIVIHEIIPIVLMTITNLSSLVTLYTHSKLNKHHPTHKDPHIPAVKRVPAEIRAAKVILALIVAFIVSWGASVISVNYVNYNGGPSSGSLLVLACFSNSGFIASSPFILAVGHRRLRAVIKSVFKCRCI
ncbi:olfactory receptor class A-like protein 4 [Hoplias malabaricus]|uniref:olfactory receptor class A-like protein 4 n=1 Tax=Hoplias malabaricus TaxID=27720 RepID=UPI00346254A7